MGAIVFILALFIVSPCWAYDMPIGIPAPPTVAGVKWCVESTRDMYLDCDTYKYDYGDGAECYKVDSAGHPYSYYIDPDNSTKLATDSGNTYGTEGRPRYTRPNGPLADGTVVYYDGGNTTAGWGHIERASGTNPIFITGNPDNKPVFRGVSSINSPIDMDYVVFENFKMNRETYNSKAFYAGDTQVSGSMTYDSHTHICIRNSEIYNGQEGGSNSRQVIRFNMDDNRSGDYGNATLQNIVIYNNYFHDINHARTIDASGDVVAISIGLNTKNVWILNNEAYKVGGDLIQISSDSSSGNTDWFAPYNIYIGANTAHDVFENIVDLKQCHDVILSQNTCYDLGAYGTSIATLNTPFRYGTADIKNGDQKTNIWTLFNTVYNVDSPGGAFSIYASEYTEPFPDEIYFIGNIVYNCHNSDGDATAFGVNDSRKVYWANNLAYNVDRGFQFYGDRGFKDNTYNPAPLGDNESITFVNNIISTLDPTGDLYLFLWGSSDNSRGRAVFKNNIFYDSSGNSKGRLVRYTEDGNGTLIGGYIELTDYADILADYPEFLVDSTNADPRLTNPAGGDFRPLSSSPAINSGFAHTYAATFLSRYGVSIGYDYAGLACSLNGQIGPYCFVNPVTFTGNFGGSIR